MVNRILICVCVLTEIALALPAFGAYGDCTGYLHETNADCDNMADCLGAVSTTCIPIPGTTNYGVVTNSMKVGNCHNGFWDNGCVYCATLVCASYSEYSGIDANGQCTGLIGTFYFECTGCCGG